jgi:hypothetical protein
MTIIFVGSSVGAGSFGTAAPGPTPTILVFVNEELVFDGNLFTSDWSDSTVVGSLRTLDSVLTDFSQFRLVAPQSYPAGSTVRVKVLRGSAERKWWFLVQPTRILTLIRQKKLH